MTLIQDTDACDCLSCPDEISIALESDLFDDMMDDDLADEWKQVARLISLEGVSNKAQQDLDKPVIPNHYLIENMNQVNPTSYHHRRQSQQQRKRAHEDSFTTLSAYCSPIVKRKRTISPTPVSCESSISSQSSDALKNLSVTRTDPNSTAKLSSMSSVQLNSQLCYLAGKLARSMEKSEASRSTLFRQGLIDRRRLWRNLDTNSEQPLVQPQFSDYRYNRNNSYCAQRLNAPRNLNGSRFS